jgi:hypothetical protein
MQDENIKENSLEKVFVAGTLICYYKFLLLLQKITSFAYGKVSYYWSFIGGVSVVVGILLVQWRTLQNASGL